nr:ribonuclease H-like domain-containing protein [Saprospiraceae bacterium]
MIQICDIEIARNLFLIGLKDYPSEKETLLEVSEHVDERKQFLTWYNSKTRKDLLVTFNGISYDVPVINFAYNIFSKDTSSLREQLLLIHNYSQSLIEKGKRKKKVKGYYTDLFGEKHTVYENEDEDETNFNYVENLQ